MTAPKKMATKKRADTKAVGKRTQTQKRGKNKVPVHGERKKSATGSAVTNVRARQRLADGEVRLISYEKNSDGTSTVRVGRATTALLEGTDDVREWSDKELLQGHRDNIRRPPNMVPMAVYQELANRVMSKARFYWVAELEVAMTKCFQIVKNIDPNDKDRKVTMVEWLAIKEIFERVMGSPEQKVTIGLEPESWKAAIADALVPSTGDIIDLRTPQEPEPDDDDPINAAL
jgi:hypothetical protein